MSFLGLGIGLMQNVAATSGGGVAWTPASLPGLVRWVANDPTTMFTDAGTTAVSADGQSVYQWNDKSGNGHHLTQTTLGNRPIYKAGTKAYLNFDGSVSEIQDAASFAQTDGTGQHYFAIACYFNTVASTQVIAEIAGATQVSWVFCSSGAVSTMTSWNTSNASTNETGPSITGATPTVLIYTVTPSALEVFVDNVSDGATAVTGSRQNITAALHLGEGGGGFYTAGRIYGVVQGTGTLSSSDRASLQAYMASLHP